ncbi:hypothetical protein BDV96DRAFT_569584 [Lophiotrema nucula]|uniref:Uncharacterized protein n=1 Tax=Lophiotrema nucula TaxID=690887 RepID=A0A6A5ZGD3_9PLEO|nr:hypothetical protein BDV96DRAFT_569584 [Lophiotrema nucula]
MTDSKVLVAIVVLLVLCSTAQASKRFEDWFWYDNTFNNIIRYNCSTEYNNYINHHDSRWWAGWPTYEEPKGERTYWKYLHPILICLLDTTDDLNKAEMASAGVLLGLMPTILAYAGSNLTETALLSLRRPVFACLLAIGSPAVPPLRSFTHEDVPKMLTRRKSGMTVNLATPSWGVKTRALVVGIELVLVLAAIGNVFYASYELGVKTVISWSGDVSYHPLMWSCLTGGVHIWGSMVLRQDVVEIHASRDNIGQKMRVWVKNEFTPCAAQDTPTVLKYRPDTFRFLFVSWWAAIFTLGHYIYGTVIFSSMLFISVPAATKILVRFLSSTLCCRIIVTYELSGMRYVSQKFREDTASELQESAVGK